jgi:quercetin dioxygenase-like cupin family protein
MSTTIKKYYIDLDNTLCHTVDGDYANAVPLPDRIHKVSDLKAEGHHITIWTARGSRSGIDYEELTKKQLEEWAIPYDVLLMGKPDYDVYIDDKSWNTDSIWPMSNPAPTLTPLPTKKLPSEIVPKGWGKEIIFVNNEEYCGKILCFDKGKRFSMHYHIKKRETWYVNKGRFRLTWIDTEHGITHTELLEVGDVITNERGEPHQLEALEDSEVFEVSTRHYDEDSYRIKKGD